MLKPCKLLTKTNIGLLYMPDKNKIFPFQLKYNPKFIDLKTKILNIFTYFKAIYN